MNLTSQIELFKLWFRQFDNNPQFFWTAHCTLRTQKAKMHELVKSQSNNVRKNISKTSKSVCCCMIWYGTTIRVKICKTLHKISDKGFIRYYKSQNKLGKTQCSEDWSASYRKRIPADGLLIRTKVHHQTNNFYLHFYPFEFSRQKHQRISMRRAFI